MISSRTGARLLAALAATLTLAWPAAAGPGGKSSVVLKDTSTTATWLRDSRDVSIVEIVGDYNAKLPDGSFNNGARAAVARAFLAQHPDAYDMIVVFTGFPIETSEAFAFHHSVRNDVLGIGMPTFDNSAGYGSAGKLAGMIDMADLSRHVTDPLNRDFERTLMVFSHEFLHQFAARVRYRKADGTLSNGLLGADGTHWSYLLETNSSVLYGSRWHDNGNGTFTATAVRDRYSPLDLYLMGLLPREEVPPFFLINAPGVDPAQLPQLDATVTGTKELVTIDDIIAAEGPRVPDAAHAQKEFRLAFVYAVRPGQNVTDAELTALTNIRRTLGTRFSALAGGAGHMNVFVEPRNDQSAGTPAVLPSPTSPPAVSVNLQSALAWLRGKQDVTGFWADRPPTAMRDSAVTLSTLRDLDPGFGGIPLGSTWLSGRTTATTDYLARKLTTLAQLGHFAVTGTELVAAQNADGGWGAAAGYGSNPLDTALALQTLLRRATPLDNATTQGLAYLRSQQNADGGWGNVAGGTSRSTTSAQVLLALAADSAGTAAITAGKGFLASRQNSDGGIGDSPSSVHDTAIVTGALMALNASTSIRFADALQYLSANQRTDGSWLASVYSTALAVNVLARANAMNWAVVGFTASPTRTTDGQRVTLTVSVQNTGNQPTPAGKLRVTLGDPAAGGTPVAPDADIPPLVPGATAVVPVTWNTLGLAGERTLYAQVDPNRVTAELSIADNIATLAYVVDPPGAGVDLLVAPSDIVVSPASPSSIPAQVTVSALVTNAGGGDAANVKVVLWEGTGAQRVKVGELVLASVPARSTRPAIFQATVTHGGATTFSVQVDADGTIAETNEGNNEASVTVTTLAGLDLEILAADLSIDKPAPRNGEDVTLTAKLRNRGTVGTQDFTVRHTLDAPGVPSAVIAENVIRLAAGQQVTQTVVARTARTGAHVYRVEIDATGVVPESDETNNTATLTFNVAADSGPSLAVVFSDLLATPSPALEGAALRIDAIIRNLGSQSASQVEVAFYLGDPAQGGTPIGGVQTIPTLAAGASATLGATLPDVADASNKVVFVVVDPANLIPADTVREDNRAFISVPVKALPDLAISSGSLTLTPPLPRPGDAVSLQVQVLNSGQQPASSVLVRAYDGDPAAGGTQVGGDQVIALLDAQATANVQFSWNFPASSGERVLYVRVDPLQAVNERNRSNNAAQLAVGVQSGDYAVSPRIFSPNGDGVLETVELTFRFASARTATIQVVGSASNVVRHYSGTELGSVEAGRWVWDGRDDNGAVARDDDYRIEVLVGGVVQGGAAVTLDTNRSSLVDAFGTPLALATNLSCQIPNDTRGPPSLASDGSLAYFVLRPSSFPNLGDLPDGIYRVSASGGDLRQILPAPTESGSEWAQAFASADGTQVALRRYDSGVDTLWIATAEGGGLRQLPVVIDGVVARSIRIARFDSSEVVVHASFVNGTAQIVAVPTSGAAAWTVVAGDVSLRYSPNGRKLVVVGGGASPYAIVDVATGASTALALGDADAFGRYFLWSPDSSTLAVVERESRQVKLFAASGVAQGTYTVDAPGIVKDADWGRDATELYISTGNANDCFSGDCTIDSRLTRISAASGVATLVRRLYFVPTPGAEALSDATLLVTPIPGQPQLLVQEVIQPACDCGGRTRLVAVSTDAPFASRTLIERVNEGEVPWVAGAIRGDDGSLQSLFGGDTDVYGYYDFGRLVLSRGDNALANPGQSCATANSSDELLYRSLANLTAELRAVRGTTSIRLVGTATDKHFARYTLEYARAETPTTWSLVAPVSTTPVANGDLALWAPPATGRYVVRLTVEDLAGNRREVSRNVTWGAITPIADVSRAPEYISPNGDGVQDAVVLRYQVLFEVNLEINVYDAQGARVRNFVRSHSVPVVAQVAWDGRDNSGNVVADGTYRITVLDYEFSVKVDNRRPRPMPDRAGIATLELAFQPGLEPAAFSPSVPNVRLYWHLVDENLAKVEVQVGDGATPSEWTTVRESNRADVLNPFEPFLITFNDVATRRYRVVATDYAGNVTTQLLSLPVDVIITNSFRNGSWVAQPGSAVQLATFSEGYTFEVVETVPGALAQWAVEYQGPYVPQASGDVPPAGPNWSTRVLPLPTAVADHVLPPVQPLSGAFTSTWDLAELDAPGVYYFRVRFTDQGGTITRGANMTIVRSAVFDIRSIADDLPPPNPPNTILVSAEERLGQVVSRIDLYIGSTADPAYFSERVVYSRPGAPTSEGLGLFGIPLLESDLNLRSCTDYQFHLVATLAGGATATSHIQTYRRCPVAQAYLRPVDAACGALPSGRQVVALRSAGAIQDGVPIVLLEFGRKRADGTDDIVYSKVNPVHGQGYEFELSTDGLPEGVFFPADRPYFVRATDADGRHAQSNVKVVVDRTPVQARITYPSATQRICAKQIVDDLGRVFRYVDLEGTVTDAAGFSYRLEYGIGASPTTWNPFGAAKPGCVGAHNSIRVLGDRLWNVDNTEAYASTLNNIPVPCGAWTALQGKEVTGAIARLFNANGEVTARITARDWGGYQSCAAVTFAVDGEVEAQRATISRVRIAPGVLEPRGATQIAYRVDEPLQLTVLAYRKSDLLVDAATGRITVPANAVPVRRVADNVPISGEGSVEWDGRSDGGGLVDDGDYILIAGYADACGNTRAEEPFAVHADRTPPTVVITRPSANLEVGGIVEVAGTARDATLDSFTLEYGTGDDPQTWATIAGGRQDVNDAVLGSWNTLGLAPGRYTLRLRALDLSGNTAETRVGLTVRAGGALVAGVDIAPAIFSPNADGVSDQSAIHFSATRAATATVRILQGATVVRTLATNSAVPAGNSTIAWDGRNDVGVVVAEGTYQVALDVTDGVASESLLAPVVVDVTPPAVTVDHPTAPFARSTDSIIATIADANLLEYRASLRALDPPVGVTVLDEGTVPREAYPLGSLAGYAEGRYEIVIEARDRAGNARNVVVPFTLDNVAPMVTINAPAPNAVLGPKPVGVTGQIVEANLLRFRLNLQGPPPAPPIELASGAVLPTPIHDLNVAGKTDGAYQLQLVAEDRAGWVSTATVPFIVDNTPPVAQLASTLQNAYLRAGSQIRGTATDANFLGYKLEISPANATRFTEVASGAAPVTDAALATLNALPPDGAHTLRLTVTDKADNTSVAIVQVTIDTVAPVAPANLAVRVENRRDAVLTWTAVADTDLAGYYVYRGGVRVTADPIAAITFTDAGLPEGDHDYTVTAVDRAGNESARSAVARARVSLTTPTAQILAPTRDSRVSGVVDIRGSAFSARDFKEYRLSVGAGAAPATYTLLKRSTVSAQGEALAPWSTVALPEGAVFTIQLEAEDTFGAIGRDAVTVTVDNLAPAAPLNLQATVAASDVTLTWTANTEPDIDGYLLYRGGRLVNQAGPITGEVRAFLIRGTTYLDRAVPDGTQSYTVVAVDLAGNQSAASAPRVVTIDTRIPVARIVKPAAEARVDRNVYVQAASSDEDIASIQLQFRAVGTSAWTPIGAPLTAEPYGREWDLSALAYGDYELSAKATDTGGRFDPDPPAIRITRARLDRPAQPRDLVARVAGGAVTLTWTAVTSPDLAGYLVDRIDSEGTPTRLTASPVTAASYVDNVAQDGLYQYTVTSISTFDTRSDASDPASARVFSIDLTQPYTPTDVRTATLAGSGRASLVARLTIVAPSGTSTIDVPANAQGAFSFPGIALEVGDNRFSVAQVDPAGNTSRAATAHVRVGNRPAKPVGLAASASGDVASLTWTANTDADLGGYYVSLDGQPRLEAVAATGASATTQDVDYGRASFAIDGDTDSQWNADGDDQAPALTVSLERRALLGRIEIRWGIDDPGIIPARFALDAWDGEVWVEVARGAPVATDFVSNVQLAQPYLADRIRVRILERGFYQNATVAEVVARAIRTTTTASDSISPINAQVAFTVTALSTLGLAGAPSDAVQATVGDIVPPQPVTLQATVAARDVTLTWTASASADVARYEVRRDGTAIATVDVPALTYTDTGLTNGQYSYVVVAIDIAGNRSTASNAVPATVAVNAVGAPQALAVVAVPTGGALDLTWSAPTSGPAPVRYGIERATVDAGPYAFVAEASGTSFRDMGLTNGTRYYYRVYGINTDGEGGLRSAAASGVPAATAAIASPALIYPASAARPATVTAATTLVAGQAEPGADVTLVVNGFQAGTVRAAAEATVRSSSPGSPGRVSPDGQWAIGGDFDAQLRAMRPDSDGNDSTLVRRFTDLRAQGYAWAGSGRVAYASERFDPTNGQPIRRAGYIDVEDPTPHALDALELLDTSIAATADGRYAYVFAQRDTRRGLWRIELTANVATPVVDLAGAVSSPTLSPRGDAIAYVHAGRVEVLNLATTAVALQGPVGSIDPSFTASGDAVLYSADGKIHVHPLAGAATALTPAATDARGPSASPDGTSVAYVENSRVYTVAISGGAPVPTDLDGLRVDWLPSGYLVADYYGTLMIQTRPGHFAIRDVLLRVGENRATATASLGGGPSSVLSAAAIIVYSTADRPDLVVSAAELVAIPGVPSAGEATRVSITVRNTGPRSAPAAQLTLQVRNPDGTTATLFDSRLTAMASGAQQTVTVDWTPATQGTYQFAATVDRANEVAEFSESNNVATREFQVSQAGAPRLLLATDAAVYAQNSLVAIEARVVNGGQAFTGVLELVVEDTAGFAVTTLAPQSITALPFGQTATVTRGWNTGTTLAGPYKVRATLRNAAGTIVASETAAITIDAPANATATLTTDRAEYSAGTTVHLLGRVAFAPGSGTGLTGETLLRVFDATNQVRFEILRPLAFGSTADVNGDWVPPAQSAGDYTARLDVRQDGRVIATASAAFRLLAEALAPPTVSLVAPADNTVVTAPGRILISAGASSPNAGGSIAKVEFFNGATKLGEKIAPPYTFDWADVPAGSYALTARATDNRGVTADSAAVHVIVNSPPTVAITSPANGAAYDSPAAIAITAQASDSDGTITKLEVYRDTLKLGECAATPCTVTWNGVGAGTYPLTAIATDNRGARTTSAPVLVVVAGQSALPPTVALTAPIAGAVAQAPGSFTLAATASSPNAGGSIGRVEFYAGADKIGEVLSTPYTFNWANAAAGSYDLRARAFDNRGVSSDSAAVAVIVNAQPTAAITSPANGATFTAPASLTVTAQAADTDGNVTLVEVFQGSLKLGECAASPCAVAWNNVPAGTYSLTAVATDNRGGHGTSAVVAVVVGPALVPPNVALTAPAANALFQAPATIALQVTASSPNAGGSIAKVEFFNGATKVGEALAPPYTASWTNVAAGSYALTARATDNRGVTADSAAVPIVVNAQPTASITAPANNASYETPAQITVTAQASDSDGTITKVEVFQGATKLGECSTSPCAVAWNNVAAGTYSLTAVATDNRSGHGTSPVVTVVVGQALLPPNVALTAPTANALFQAPATIALQATASSPNAGGSITKVEFFNGATKVGEALATPFAASWTNVAAGNYTLTARATDNRGVTTDSAGVPIVVNAQPTASITAPAANTAYLAPATIQVSATAADTDGTITKVEIFAGATKLGECAASPCAVTWNNVVAGSYVLTARATDNRSGTFTSSGVAITVTNLAGSVSATPSPADIGQSVQVSAQVTSPAAATGVPLRVRIADAADATLAQFDTTATLAAGTPFAWTFPWSTTGKPAGTHRVTLLDVRSATPVLIAETPLVLRTPVSAQLSATLRPTVRVLVLATCYQSSGTNDTPDAACALQRKAAIDELLTELGIAHRVVTDVDAFRTEMRCGTWNVFWLSGGREKLKDRMAAELAEQVRAGKGLVVDGVHDAGASALDAILGVTYVAKLPIASYNVVPIDALLASAAFPATGRVSRYLAPAPATVHARLQDAATGDPAVISNVYGGGRAVALAFDLAGSMASAPAAEANVYPILARAASGVQASGTPVKARVSIVNTGSSGAITVTATLPAGVTLRTANPAPASGTTWNFPNVAGGATATIDVELDAIDGTYSATFNAGSASTALAFEVGPTSGGSHAAVVSALNGLTLSGLSATARDTAVGFVNQSAGLLSSQPEASLYKLLDASVEVAKISSATAIHRQLARLANQVAGSWCTAVAACMRPDAGTPTFGAYGVLVFGNASFSNGTVEGSVGIAGNATLSNQLIASEWTGDAGRLNVGGTLTYSSGSVGRSGTGAIRVGSTMTLNAGVGRGSAVSPVVSEDWVALENLYRAESTRVATATGAAPTIESTGVFVFTGANPARNVFAMQGSQMGQVRTMVFNVPLGSTTIVNVSGGAASLANVQQQVVVGGTRVSMAQHAYAANVLFNFPQATSLAVSNWSIQGTVLAPRASLSLANGIVFGQLFVDSLSTSSTNYQQCGTFKGTLP